MFKNTDTLKFGDTDTLKFGDNEYINYTPLSAPNSRGLFFMPQFLLKKIEPIGSCDYHIKLHHSQTPYFLRFVKS